MLQPFWGGKDLFNAQDYYCPKIYKDVGHYVKRSSTCQLTKDHMWPQGLYSPLYSSRPLGRCNLRFYHRFATTQRYKDFIIVVVDRFQKMAHFIAWHTTNDTSHIINLYFKEIVRLQAHQEA